MSNPTTLRIGIVGAGGFAQFAAKAFLHLEGVRISAVTDTNPDAARALAKDTEAREYADLPSLLREAPVDLIYIATPPFLHYPQSKQALEAGKHVICEKPAALKTAEAEELARYAESRNLLYTVNLMQRYNPLYEVVKTIIAEKWLGDFVHGFFENYANDTALVREHWFWDEEKSGGIFIEHGVHFFDMFSGWLGEGELLSALQLQRTGVEPAIVDRVQATVLYPGGIVNFYHGFNQPKELDRQELRLQFDRGDITLYEWVPVKIRLHGMLNHEQIARFQQWIPSTSTQYKSNPHERDLEALGKFRQIHYDALVTLVSGDPGEKMRRYEQLVTSMLRDQWNWIKNPAHRRVIDGKNAVESLRMAEEATKQSSLISEA